MWRIAQNASKPLFGYEPRKRATTSRLGKRTLRYTLNAHPHGQPELSAPMRNSSCITQDKEPDSPADGTLSMISTSNDEDAIVDCTSTTARRNTVVRGEHASRADGLGLEGKPMPLLDTTVPDLSSTQLWCVPGKKNNAGIFADSYWWKVRYES